MNKRELIQDYIDRHKDNETLNKAACRAQDALESGNPDDIAMAFLSLGAKVEESQFPSHEIIIDALKADRSLFKRELPLKIRNAKATALKEVAQELAVSKWEQDKEKKIRILDMCNLIYSDIDIMTERQNITDLMPLLPEGLKPWLREVAPGYAKKAGAPKKRKK